MGRKEEARDEIPGDDESTVKAQSSVHSGTPTCLLEASVVCAQKTDCLCLFLGIQQ